MPLTQRGALGGVAALGAIVATAMCAQPFDTTRATAPTQTLGQNVFQVVCERVDVGENPSDVDFSAAAPLCTGTMAPPDGGMTMANVGPKVLAMAARRAAISNAIDRAIPTALQDAVARLLINLLPLYGPDGSSPDGGTILLVDGGRAPQQAAILPETTESVGRLLLGIGNDTNATAALSRNSYHQGFRPQGAALGLTRLLLGYTNLTDVLSHLLPLIREPEGTTPAGAAWPQWSTALDVLHGEFAQASPASPTDQQEGTTLDVVTDLLLRGDPNLGSGTPRLLVRRDPYGMPRIATDASGNLPAPFVDVNPPDGFADSVNGRFVDASGVAINLPSPFPATEALDGPRDNEGRVIVPGTGAPLYQYVDLDQSVFAALLHDSRTLVDPANSIAMQFAHGASVLFGVRTPVMQDYMLQQACGAAGTSSFSQTCAVPQLQYTAFDASEAAPLVDTVQAVGLMMTAPEIDRVLGTVQQLFSNYDGLLARNMGAILAINDDSKRHPEATMAQSSNIWDDMIGVATQMAQVPGLLEDIITATQSPSTVQLGPAFAALGQNRDRIEPDWSSQCSQNVTFDGQTLNVPVNRMLPDTQDYTGGPMDNRSVLQRFLHLISDLNGVPLCNKEGAQVTFTVTILGCPVTIPYPTTYHQCELINIPDAAVFYLQSILGTAHITLMDSGLLGWLSSQSWLSGTIDDLIQSQSGITGFTTTPTPESLNRVVFQPDSARTPFMTSLLDPVLTKDGLDIRQVHPATIFALEEYNIYTAIAPLIQAFDVHPGGDHLFVQLLSELHLHYPTNLAGQYQHTDPTMPFYDTMDGAERYEPILVDAFAGDILPAMNALTTVLPNIDAGGGETGLDGVAALARVLLDPNAVPNIQYRDGRTTTLECDGTTVVTNPNIYNLLADSMNEIDTRFQSNASQLSDWQTARSHLVDTFLSVDNSGTANAVFHNPRIPYMAPIAVQWLRDRIAAHQAVGDWPMWGGTLASRFANTLFGPSFSSAYDMLMATYNDTPTNQAVGGMLMSILDDTTPAPNNNFAAAVTGLADAFQILRDDTDVDPIMHALSPAFQRAMPAANGNVLREESMPTTVRFLDQSNQADTEGTMNAVLLNMVTRPASSAMADEPLVVLGDSIAETHRTHPGIGGPLGPNDFQAVFSQASDFLTDQSRGMEQFYYIVQHRRE